MAKADIAALLAVAAALMIGIGDVLEQRSAQQVTDKPVGTVALFRRLLRDRRWWAGSLVAGAGFGLQAAALGLGSVVLVQALSVTSLLFALVISAKVEPPQNHPLARDLGRATRRRRRGSGDGRQPAGRDTPRVISDVDVVAVIMGPALILCVIGARYLLGFGQRAVAGADVWLAVGPVLGVDQGRGRPARPRHPGNCSACPSYTCGRCWGSPRQPGSSRRFGPAR